jgi:hypothetical protein
MREGGEEIGGAHIAHGNHVVDLLDAKPVQHVWHESLKAHVFHASNKLGGAEVLVCGVATALSKIVDKIFGHLPERTAFLAEVHDNANTAALRCTDALLDREHEVRFASADIRTKHIRTITCKLGKGRGTQVGHDALHSSCTRKVSSLLSSERNEAGPTAEYDIHQWSVR